jgi:hypothetical protein
MKVTQTHNITLELDMSREEAEKLRDYLAEAEDEGLSMIYDAVVEALEQY